MRLTTTGWRDSYTFLLGQWLIAIFIFALVVWVGTIAIVGEWREIKQGRWERETARMDAQLAAELKQNEAMEWAATYLCDTSAADLVSFTYNDYGLTDVQCTKMGTQIIR
jgi:hypothetical protein